MIHLNYPPKLEKLKAALKGDYSLETICKHYKKDKLVDKIRSFWDASKQAVTAILQNKGAALLISTATLLNVQQTLIICACFADHVARASMVAVGYSVPSKGQGVNHVSFLEAYAHPGRKKNQIVRFEYEYFQTTNEAWFEILYAWQA